MSIEQKCSSKTLNVEDVFFVYKMKDDSDMRIYLYKKGITILALCAVILCVMKANQVNGEVVEVNYIGDLEQENQESMEESEDGTSEELQDENLDIDVVQEKIRVLLSTEDFESYTHDEVALSAPSGLLVTYISQEEEMQDQVMNVCIDNSDESLYGTQVVVELVDDSEKITVESLERAYGIPSYYGSMELFIDDEGVIMVNEISLELYLRGVLPSEMPASYEMEALKAQAVCARSYAYMHMQSYNYPEYSAHVDDSTAYQVYNNCEETEATNQAITETENEKVIYKGEVVTTYFFSTSSGHTTDLQAWGMEVDDGTGYLTGIQVSDGEYDYERNLSWYRWTVALTNEQLVEVLEENLEIVLGELEEIQVSKWGTGGIALELQISGSECSVTISTEYDIRDALGSNLYTIVKQDGTTIQGTNLLPSAFFEIEKMDYGYVISGGGYGHGVGMSQNGANEMAKLGMTYSEILAFFYTGTEISI